MLFCNPSAVVLPVPGKHKGVLCRPPCCPHAIRLVRDGPTLQILHAQAGGRDDPPSDDDLINPQEGAPPQSFRLPATMAAPESWFAMAAFCKLVIMVSPWSPFLLMMYTRGTALPVGYVSVGILGLAAFGLAYLAKYILDKKILERKWGPPVVLLGSAITIFLTHMIVTVISMATRPPPNVPPAPPPPSARRRPGFGSGTRPPMPPRS